MWDLIYKKKGKQNGPCNVTLKNGEIIITSTINLIFINKKSMYPTGARKVRVGLTVVSLI
jgi:hypothetical protein